MDEQDETRILPAVAAANTQAAIERVLQSMDSKWKSPLSANDWMLYNHAVKLRKEMYE